MLLSEAFELYCSDVIQFKNQSSSTEENHYICLRALLVFFNDVPVESISFSMVRDWKIALEKTRSPNTVRNYIIRFRVVLDFCNDRGVICLKSSQVPVPKRGDKVPDFISKEDVSTLIRVVSKPAPGYAKTNRLKNAAIIAMLYASGIRVSELCGLNRSDIHDDGSFTVVGKGRKARLCFIDDRAMWLINEYLYERDDNDMALFVSQQTKRRITPGNVQEVFRLARKKAGFVNPIHPHTLRHSFATNLLKNNANIRYVQVMLGHSSLETTQMYTHVVDEDLRAIYQKHHSV